MRVLVAMSGGVDSSVAAALLLDEGHDVVGVTLKLWGGESDSGCCSVSDVDDARRVADRLGVEHHVFNFEIDFSARVVEPYVADHLAGRTPNPCIECNRHLKFDRLLERARVLGFDAVATGHHARVVRRADGTRRVARGADRAKDQSYVLHMLDQAALARCRFPIGDRTKDAVRDEAQRRGLRTAAKPDSQDLCFIRSTEGRRRFVERRAALTPGRLVDLDGHVVGGVPAVELVTVGQRRGLGAGGDGTRRFAIAVDVPQATVLVGAEADMTVPVQPLEGVTWAAGRPPSGPVQVQCSAHGAPRPGWVEVDAPAPAGAARALVRWRQPERRVAPGQAVVVYEGDEVAGGGVASAAPPPPAPSGASPA
ncbi:MAG: tRNA 2-thiouridine(34) synthase MnmA [Actinobacteria bacterium]|nr:tRNA 2-thiouridine(34) synthase MnmA [Actinomycetota bacterium]